MFAERELECVFLSALGGDYACRVFQALEMSVASRLPMQTILNTSEALGGLLSSSRDPETELAPRGLADTDHRMAVVAHDLRHLLTIVGLQIERIGGAGLEDIARTRQELGSMLAAARHLCSELMCRHYPPQVEEVVDLRSFLELEAGAAAHISCRTDQVQLFLRCLPDVQLRLDRSLLSRLVRNLLLNAIEATPDGGEVHIEAFTRADSALEIHVRDTGRGMPAAEVEGLLSFGRSGGQGTGVGTESVRTCVERLDAELEIETRLGEGTRVVVRLGAHRPEVSALIVDHDDRRGNALAVGLTQGGVPARWSPDAGSAVTRMDRCRVNGLAVVRGLRGPGLCDVLAAARSSGATLEFYNPTLTDLSGMIARMRRCLPLRTTQSS